jgi:hypothetical protein
MCYGGQVQGVLRGAPEYLVHERLGEGGMAIVHLGTMVTPAGERPVAIKQVRGLGEASDAMQERVIAEARLVFQLTHANICQVLDLASSAEGTFIVMELVDGLDLGRLLQKLAFAERALDVGAALYIAQQVAAALDYAHRKKDASGHSLWLVHGDVSPHNVLLSREGEVKLTDFGIARALGTLAPGNELKGGTPGFAAPEVAEERADHRSDIFSLGKLLEAALGAADVPTEIRAIIEHATERNKEQRTGSAAELREQLSRVLARHCPSFSVAQLAALINEHAVPGERKMEKTGRTLVSLAKRGLPPADTGEEMPPVERRTVAAVRSEKRGFGPLAILSALLLVTGASVAWWRYAMTPEQPIATVTVPAPITIERAQPVVAPAPADPAPADPPKHVTKSLRETGFLTVHAEPWGSVWVDGRKVSEQTPLFRLPTTTGRHQVYVMNPDLHRRSVARAVEVHNGKDEVVGFEW